MHIPTRPHNRTRLHTTPLEQAGVPKPLRLDCCRLREALPWVSRMTHDGEVVEATQDEAMEEKVPSIRFR